jgi:hypothetical protein
VAYYDRVLVMDQGAAAEYGSPLALLDDRATIFHRMCQRSGDFDLLRAMAADSDAAQRAAAAATADAGNGTGTGTTDSGSKADSNGHAVTRS